MKVKILLSYPCRSDEALITPIVEKLNQENCDVFQINLVSGNYLDSYKICEDHLNSNQYDLCIAIGDRIEQLSLVQCAFFHNIKIAHYGSGITNTIATFDDINRHSIALMAEICLCEGVESAMRVSELWGIIGKKIPRGEMRIDIVGNLYLDTIDDIDESLVPSEPYDLVLINPETLRNSYMNEYLSNEYTPKNKKTIWIGSNPDQKECEYWKIIKTDVQFYKNLPRPQYLGLLKNCQRFISNSSSIYYECFPLGLKPEQVIQVGERNKNRSTPREWNQDYKTSERIVEIIKKWWLKKNEN